MRKVVGMLYVGGEKHNAESLHASEDFELKAVPLVRSYTELDMRVKNKRKRFTDPDYRTKTYYSTWRV
jgi:hypothetical protein